MGPWGLAKAWMNRCRKMRINDKKEMRKMPRRMAGDSMVSRVAMIPPRKGCRFSLGRARSSPLAQVPPSRCIRSSHLAWHCASLSPFFVLGQLLSGQGGHFFDPSPAGTGCFRRSFSTAMDTARSISRCLSAKISSRRRRSTSFRSISSTRMVRYTVLALLPASSVTSYGMRQVPSPFLTGSPIATRSLKSTTPRNVWSEARTQSAAEGLGRA
mmetsp:Transcript_28303/g.66384  ORF Transcript_28303/g.66384 Transcript_28303/m.66384 type:complete len:213 (-) Transcript_28303:1056-1694(-)